MTFKALHHMSVVTCLTSIPALSSFTQLKSVAKHAKYSQSQGPCLYLLFTPLAVFAPAFYTDSIFSPFGFHPKCHLILFCLPILEWPPLPRNLTTLPHYLIVLSYCLHRFNRNWTYFVNLFGYCSSSPCPHVLLKYKFSDSRNINSLVHCCILSTWNNSWYTVVSQ